MGFFNVRMCSLILGWVQIVSYAITVIWFLVHICVYSHEHPETDVATTTMATMVNELDGQVLHQSAKESDLLPLEKNIEANTDLQKEVKTDLVSNVPHMIKEGELTNIKSHTELSDINEESHKSAEPPEPLDREGESQTPAKTLDKEAESHTPESKSPEHTEMEGESASSANSPQPSNSEHLEKEKENENAEESEHITTTASTMNEMVEPTNLATIITYFVWSALFLAFSIMLVLGILQERPKLMLPYIILNFISIAIGILFLIIMFIEGLVSNEGFGELMESIIYEFISVGLLIIFIIPIHIQYKRMRQYCDRTERHSLRDTATVPKPSYVHGDDV